jgi:hypothetical protein
MSNVAQFEKLVSEVGAVANYIARRERDRCG